MTTTTNGSEASRDPEGFERAVAFGRERGQNAALDLYSTSFYLDVRGAALDEGFTMTQAIVAAVEATLTLEERQEADDE